jgi:hypothetical protein
VAKRTTSIRDTEGASGADRYFSPPVQLAPVKVAEPAAASWEDTHKRWTFHAPLDVLAAIESEAKRSGLSKTAVAVAALRVGLNVPGKP